MLVNETFESHQALPALEAALSWYDEPDLWMYEQTTGRVTYIHVSNIPPKAKLSYPVTIIRICDCTTPGLAARPLRTITICGSIFISGVTRHVEGKRINHATPDSDTIV